MKLGRFFQFFFILVLLAPFLNSPSFAAPLPGRLLYIDTSQPGKTSIAIIKPDGTSKKIVSPEFENAMFPKIIERLGIIGVTNRRYNLRTEVYFLKPSQKKIRMVTSGAVFQDFSNTGNFFLFTHADDKSPLVVYSLKKHVFVKLSDRKITSANWSSKGDWIVASAILPDGSSDLFMISTKAQGIRRLTDTPGVSESFPAFANDGKHIAYITDKYGRSEIEFMNTDTLETMRPIIVGLYPSISPDDKWICYESGNNIMISRVNGLDQKIVCKGKTPIWIK
ncbi:MAG: PD40 domain-containing protein [Candidatus Riflebacteria bacterium]|nr:PD40 domain-containing protein [Candidatus Riflebacteria bacterium]